jgi:TMEM199 family protein
MSRSPQPSNLTVSLEPHLIEILQPLVGTIPAPLSAELSTLLSQTASSSSPTISYALLQSISRWARTEEAARALGSKTPPLDPLAYNMVALLAGARTSPNKKFPQMPRSSSRSETAARDISDRRAIIAVLNALLSVICTGAATWWAAQHTGWRDVWVGGPHRLVSMRVSNSTQIKSREFFCRC